MPLQLGHASQMRPSRPLLMHSPPWDAYYSPCDPIARRAIGLRSSCIGAVKPQPAFAVTFACAMRFWLCTLQPGRRNSLPDASMASDGLAYSDGFAARGGMGGPS